MPVVSAKLDKGIKVGGTTQDLGEVNGRQLSATEGETLRSIYTRRPVETQTYRTCNTALARSVGAENHVKIRTRAELDPVVSDEVAQLDTDYRAGDEPVQGNLE